MVEAAGDQRRADEQFLEEVSSLSKKSSQGLRLRTIACEIVPAVCGSSFKNKGVPLVLDAVIDFLPAPDEIPAVAGVLPDDEEVTAERPASDDQPFAALAFKIAAKTIRRVLSRLLALLLALWPLVTPFWNSVKGKKSA